MRAQSLTLAAAGAALLAPTTISDVAPLPDAVHERAGNAGPPGNAGSAGGVRAADLLAAVRDCVPVSRGLYRTDNGAPADVPVCGKRGAVFWKADLDIDCDGRPGPYCNESTDPLFSPTPPPFSSPTGTSSTPRPFRTSSCPPRATSGTTTSTESAAVRSPP
ncbi:hypothetical protein QFZ24_008626 [Streptomyces phaeochromogenes]|nr:hypothetical protein [Streptomyces phaeochromogenes]